MHSKDAPLGKELRLLQGQKSLLLNMESKRIQNRKAHRDRAALIYMSAIISALLDYLLGNWMTVLKLVTLQLLHDT